MQANPGDVTRLRCGGLRLRHYTISITSARLPLVACFLYLIDDSGLEVLVSVFPDDAFLRSLCSLNCRAKPHGSVRQTHKKLVENLGAGRHGDGNGLYVVVDPLGARRWNVRVVVKGQKNRKGGPLRTDFG